MGTEILNAKFFQLAFGFPDIHPQMQKILRPKFFVIYLMDRQDDKVKGIPMASLPTASVGQMESSLYSVCT